MLIESRETTIQAGMHSSDLGKTEFYITRPCDDSSDIDKMNLVTITFDPNGKITNIYIENLHISVMVESDKDENAKKRQRANAVSQ